MLEDNPLTSRHYMAADSCLDQLSASDTSLFSSKDMITSAHCDPKPVWELLFVRPEVLVAVSTVLHSKFPPQPNLQKSKTI